jgi:hypothetical protein
VTAHAAGAEQVCEPPAASALRACIENFIPHWRDLTGLPDPSRVEAAAIPVVWRHAFMTAWSLQSSASPPASCDEVRKMARMTPAWRICSIDANLPGALAARPLPQVGRIRPEVPNGD